MDHGLAAVLGIGSIALQIWVAKWLFQNLMGINRNLARLLERVGLDTLPPPSEADTQPMRRRPKGGRLLPRAPTPLPFWPPKITEQNKPGGE
jgi:hypothetical protein